MYRNLLLIVFIACSSLIHYSENNLINANESDNSYDTTVKYFGQKLKFRIDTLGTIDFDFETKNALFTISRLSDNKVILKDSIGCMIPYLEFADYNSDGTKDILVYHAHGARANTTYYLYLADNKLGNFHKVDGFEDVPNAQIDKRRIIKSIALYGKLGYSFYIITKDYKLKQIGETVEIDPNDSDSIPNAEYNRVLKILRKKF